METIKQRAQRILGSLTKEELVQHFENAGFEVFEGMGRILNDNNEDITDLVFDKYVGNNETAHLTKEETEGFERMFSYLNPLLESKEFNDELNLILENDPELKIYLENEANRIIELRNSR